MKSMKSRFILLAGALSALAFYGSSGLAQRQRATTTPPVAPTNIPVYGPSQSSNQNPAAAEPPTATRRATAPRRLSPLDQLRAGDFTLRTLEGQPVAMADLLAAGKPALIQFWQTGCEQSQAQIAFLHEIWGQYQRQGLTLLALTIEDPAQRQHVNSFKRAARLQYPVYFAPPSLYRLMSGGLTGTPQTYLFSRDGHIASRLIGWEPKRGRPALEAALENIFGQ